MRARLKSLGEWSGTVVTVGGILLLMRMILPILVPILLPFLIAWGLALLTQPLCRALGRRTVMPEPILRVALSLGAFLAIGGGLFLILARLWRELSELLRGLSENPEPIKRIAERIRSSLASLPLPKDAAIDPMHLIEGALGEAVSALSRAVGGAILGLPSLFLFLIVTVIASVYFALDLEKINRAFFHLIPKPWQERALSLRGALLRALLGYLRSYAALFLLTLFVSLAGLLLLGVRYALLIALLLAAVDLLPVLGVGCALIPWSVSCFLFGNTRLGIGLLVLWLAVTVLRQALEPRLLGERLGLTPLATLVSIYAGLKLCGVMGMLLAPLLFAMVKSAIRGADEAKGSAKK